ncbi:tetratricopeptide repeat protein [Aestuariibius sp. HNIBRBA575]|uniref:tetratricopeptide repeat-containing glycosyltransferase family protein n=1 Tax=Aestuariibius sp. HNIBRBA575 TaxID=3233343 RepID=UPI0034A3F965
MQTLSNDQLAALRHGAINAHQKGDIKAAQDAYCRYLSARPKDAGIWTNLGALYRSTERHDQALRAQRRAYAVQPEMAGVRNNLANILNDVGFHKESIALRHEILEQTPNDTQQKALIGKSLRSLGRYSDAITHLEAALGMHPDDAEIKLQLGFAQLADRQFEAGLQNYEARWDTAEAKPISIPYPKWDGGDLTGKKVLVVPEQGFGDAVLMMRFLPQLREIAGRVHVMAEKPMARLFETAEGIDWIGKVVSKDEKFDVWMTVMDLPRVGLKTVGDIPPPTRLNTPTDAKHRAAQIVAPYKDVFKVGIVWSGSVTFKGNSFRSFGHQEFLRLVDLDDVQLFSLYKGPALEAFQADGSAAFIVDAASTDRDFADCAAMMQDMDLVITSDTATAHIAGSLGVPVWTLLHWDPFWFFGHTGDTMPWYPSMRLFRQTAPHDWGSVFDQVQPELIKCIKDWKKER